MITEESIRSYLKTQPNLTSIVFYSFLSNKSELSKSMQRSMLQIIKKYLHNQKVEISSTPDWLESVIEHYSIDDVHILFKNQEVQNERKMFYIFTFISNISYKLMGRLLELDMTTVSKEEYPLLIDALFLVTLHNNL